MLLDAKADPTACVKGRAMKGMNALFYACWRRDDPGKIRAWLARFPSWDLAHRAGGAGGIMAINFIALTPPNTAHAVEELLCGSADVESVGDLGSSPLFLAAT